MTTIPLEIPPGVYRNGTGKPIMVALEINGTIGLRTRFQVSTDSSTRVTIGFDSNDGRRWGSFIIPNGHYYRARGGDGVNIWSELR